MSDFADSRNTWTYRIAVDGASRPSEAKTKKRKRKYVSRTKDEQEGHTPENADSVFQPHASVKGLNREERILLYQKRLENRKNKNIPLKNLFTDEVYKEDEINGLKYEKIEIDGEMTD